MSFDILVQRNNSEDNRVTKNLSLITTLSGVLKMDSSIIDPVIIVEGSMSDFASANYLTISDFGRSYFIRDIRTVRMNLLELSCHVDVLTSFAEEIKANRAIVRRQENNWNLYLNDGSFRVYQNPIVLTKAFPSGFSTQEYVLAVAGS